MALQDTGKDPLVSSNGNFDRGRDLLEEEIESPEFQRNVMDIKICERNEELGEEQRADSGFSDSERSSCSACYENDAPRRRRRRNKHRIRSKISRDFLENDFPPNPAYTSTPKESRIVDATTEKLWTYISNAKQKNLAPREEIFSDFLYATEPPEDETQVEKGRYSVGFECLDFKRDVFYASVKTWLKNLALETENECCTTLQSKSLPCQRYPKSPLQDYKGEDLRSLSSLATSAANKLLQRVEKFYQNYRFVFESVSHLKAGKSEKELLRLVEEDAFEILSGLAAPPPRRIQRVSLKEILSQLESIKNQVDRIVDARLDFYIEMVIRSLEEAPRDNSDISRGALAALTVLGLAGARLGNSVARCSGIRVLLTYLSNSRKRKEFEDSTATSLRALSSVCCSSTAIKKFAEEGGPKILSDILVDVQSSQKVKTEATALLVQLTAPWTNAQGLPHLEVYSKTLVTSLTHLINSSSCAQTLLLVAAALNNLSNSRECATVIMELDAVEKLLNAVKKEMGRNVWLMEQVAALVDKLAKIPEARRYLVKVRASVALVSFLRMRPAGLENAYRQLEITAASALIRLCMDPEAARQVVAIGGVNCLPSCTLGDIETNYRLLQYTWSFRRDLKRAWKQIDGARTYESS
ncbi:hypothetical protein KM043_013929 [Ampulex compressa]|nr:hypothetical protein KM043_013929 [Ampulex compressa]